MKVRVNHTGTHEWNGHLKVRLDLFPTDRTGALYKMHHVDHPDREYTPEEMKDEALRALVPTHKETNPCLCHFVTVDDDITVVELKELIHGIFDTDTLAIFDDALIRDDGLQTVKMIMQNKKGSGHCMETPMSLAKRDSINARLKDIEVVV